MYLSKTPGIVKPFYRDLVWNIPTRVKEVFLTFDDGPTPDVTDEVLDLLALHQAKATFFCVGNNVQKHPELFQRLVDEGHAVGNHTFDHSNGWKTPDATYMETFSACQELMDTALFRPPYGRIRKSQVNLIKPSHHIIMWDILGGDFDPSTSREKCLKNVLTHTREGSIIVLHDSVNSAPKMLFTLPRVLQHFSDLGYIFSALTPDKLPSR